MDIKYIYDVIKNDWKRWAKETNAHKFILGISGGKDSSIAAALAVKIFGKDNVIGVRMPNGIQSDIDYAVDICNFLEIKSYEIDIHNSYCNIINEMESNNIEVSEDTKINLPARIRMSTLFALGQSLGARPICTCNLSEDVCGYSTLFGDMSGTYAPFRNTTVTEVLELGRFLNVPEKFIIKPPSDGLCGLTDEDKLGFTYADLDRYIRNNEGTDEFKAKINSIYQKNLFKLAIIHIPGPIYGHNYVAYAHGKSVKKRVFEILNQNEKEEN